MKKCRWFCILLVVSVFVVGAVAYQVGYGRGAADGKLKRIPFDLITYLQMYEMWNHINSPNKPALSSELLPADSVKTLIHMEIHKYDVSKKRFEDLGLGSDRFEKALKTGRSIVSGSD